MKKSVYFKLQLKRVFKHYPSVLLITFASVVGIAITVAALLYINSNADDKQKITIGIVGDTEDTYLDMAVYALQNMDNSSFYVNFTEMSEDDAKDALNKNKISGYVYVPYNYIKDVAYGRNYPAKYISSKNARDFGGIIVNELAEAVSDIITETQKGVYSAIELAEDINAEENLYEKTEKLNMGYFKFVLNRHEIYSLDFVGIKDHLSYGGYYICGFLVFFLMIWGISCNKILSAKNYGLSRSLYSRGMNPVWQILCEYTGYFIVTFVTVILIAFIAGGDVSNCNLNIRELEGADILYCVGFAFKIIPVIIMFTAMHFMVYEIFDNIVSSILVQFIIAVGLGYVSGCFYPNTFFPETVQKITYYLPSGAGFSYVRKMMSGVQVNGEFEIIMIYAVIFILTAIIIRKYRLGKDGVK